MNHLTIVIFILAMAAIVVFCVVIYRRGKLNSLLNHQIDILKQQQVDNSKQIDKLKQLQNDNLKQREALKEDIISRDKQIRTLQSQISDLQKAHKTEKTNNNIKKIELLEDKLRQKSREISLLSEASLFLTTGDFQKTCDLVTFRVGILPHVKFARLYMLNDKNFTLKLVSGYNISEKYIEMIKGKFELSLNNIPAGVAVNSKAPFVVNDVHRDSYFARWREITTMYDYRSYIAVPLLRTESILGVLEIFFEKEDIFTKESLDIINIIANTGALAIENCLFIEKLQELSIIDEMTSAYNHRFLMNTFEKELLRSARHRHSLSFVMCDLDKFKIINDTLGHLKGNEVLRSVSSIIKNTLRSTDYVCRYGGDEFAILLLETDRVETTVVIEKLRTALKPLWESLPHGTNASFGFSVYPDDGSTPTELIKHADKFIYEEKHKKKKLS